MNRITVYERADFEGLSREFGCDVPDLHEVDFGDCIASLKVQGQPWVAYTGAKYEGEAHVFEEGEHRAVPRPRSFSSLRLVLHDLSEPQITLYERPHFQGARKVLTEETNLAYGYFNDRVASHEVQRGVWQLCQHPGGGGRRCLAWPGERLARYEPEQGLQGRLSHLRPLRPGRPLVSARLLWERRRVEAERDVLLDEIVAVNETGREQALAASSAREYGTALWQSFRFSNSTRLRAGLSFTLAVEAANVFTVEKGRSESCTRRERVAVQLPAAVPPRAVLSVSVLRREVTFSVPVLLTVTQNESVRTEMGEYRSVAGTHVCARYTVKPLPEPGAAPAGDGGAAGTRHVGDEEDGGTWQESSVGHMEAVGTQHVPVVGDKEAMGTQQESPAKDKEAKGTQESPAGDKKAKGTWQESRARDKEAEGTQQESPAGDTEAKGTQHVPAVGDKEAAGTQQAPAVGHRETQDPQAVPKVAEGSQRPPDAGDKEAQDTQAVPAAGDTEATGDAEATRTAQ
ncbi:epidermal differentiation-specific protein-like [Eudromia elegans]